VQLPLEVQWPQRVEDHCGFLEGFALLALFLGSEAVDLLDGDSLLIDVDAVAPGQRAVWQVRLRVANQLPELVTQDLQGHVPRARERGVGHGGAGPQCADESVVGHSKVATLPTTGQDQLDGLVEPALSRSR